MDETAFMNQLLADYDSSVPRTVAMPSTAPSTPQSKSKKRGITANTSTHSSSLTSDTSTSTSSSSSASGSDTSQTIMTATTITTTADQYDLTAFLEGCEDWDLDGDLLSPVKPKPVANGSTTHSAASTTATNRLAPTPSHSKFSPSTRLPTTPTPEISPYVEEECTRCVVECVEVITGKWQKVRHALAIWCSFLTTGQLVFARVEASNATVQIILCHDWFHTDVQPGMCCLFCFLLILKIGR